MTEKQKRENRRQPGYSRFVRAAELEVTRKEMKEAAKQWREGKRKAKDAGL